MLETTLRRYKQSEDYCITKVVVSTESYCRNLALSISGLMLFCTWSQAVLYLLANLLFKEVGSVLGYLRMLGYYNCYWSIYKLDVLE